MSSSIGLPLLMIFILALVIFGPWQVVGGGRRMVLGPRKSGKVKATAPRSRLEGFISKYSPKVAADGRAALAKMRRLVPGAVELVYDNYNWLVVGFCPSERASHAVLSKQRPRRPAR